MEKETTHPMNTLMTGISATLEKPDLGANPPPLDQDAFVRESLRAAAEERFKHVCPSAYLETDWNHSTLLPYRQQIDAIRNWQVGPKGIVASGPTSRGKTRAVFDLYRRLACVEGRDVRFYYAGDWFNMLQQQVNYGRDEAQGWVEAVAARPIVILDDLGNEAMLASRSDWAAGWFFRFLDLRVGKKLPLIVTTNLTSKQLSASMDRQDYALLRRLLEICEPVKF